MEIILQKCCVFFSSTRGGRVAKRRYISATPPPRVRLLGRRVKVVRKINPYRLRSGGENTITPIALCTGGGQQSFCILYYYYYYQFSGRTNIIKWSLSFSLSLCVRLFCVAYNAHIHTAVDRLTLSGVGDKKENTTTTTK